MSDARALLRQQQASRQINHPLAIYSASGALSCLLCDTLVKTEGLWNPHLHSSGHRARVEAQSDRDRDRENTGVKRLARDEGDNRLQSPKKRARPEEEEGREDKVRRSSLGLGVGVEITMATRPATPGRGRQMGVSQFEAVASGADVTMAEPEAPAQSVAGTTQEDGKGDKIDYDDDWAAFQADIAATTATFGGNATVSAAAKTAEQIAEEAQAETGQKKEKAEVRIEEEREEAKERLAEEFEEMEELERKVSELKERRERLKGAKLAGTIEEKVEVEKMEKEELNDDSDEDEDEDDWAGFRFKGVIN